MKHATRGSLAKVEFKTPSNQFQMHPNVAGVPRSEHMVQPITLTPEPAAASKKGVFAKIAGFFGAGQDKNGSAATQTTATEPAQASIDQLVEAKRILAEGALPREEGACATSTELKRLAVNVVGGRAQPGNLDDLYQVLSSVLFPFNLEAMRESDMGKRPEYFALTNRDWRAKDCGFRLMLDPSTVVGKKLPTANGILSDPDRQKRNQAGMMIGVDHMLQPLVIAKAVWEELAAKGDRRVAGISAHVALGYIDHDQDLIDKGLMGTDQSFFLHTDALSGRRSIIVPVMVFLNPGHPKAEIGISPLGENVPAFKSLKILSDTALLAACYLQLAENQMKLLEGEIAAHGMQEQARYRKALKGQVEVLDINIHDLLKEGAVIKTKKGTKGAEDVKLTALPEEVEEKMLDKVVDSVVECFRRSTELWPLFWESMRRIHLSYSRAMQTNMLLHFQRDMVKAEPDVMELPLGEIEKLAGQMPDRLDDGTRLSVLTKINLNAVVLASSFRDKRLFPKIQDRLDAEGLVERDDPRYEEEKK